MADAPGERRAGKPGGDDSGPKKPVAPIVPPVVPPVAKPVVPPTVAPVAKPVAPPIAKPIVQQPAAPVVKPMAPPTMKPVGPPVVAPSSPPTMQPTLKPVAPPTAAPVMKPVSSGSGKGGSGSGRAAKSADAEEGRGGRGGKGGRPPATGGLGIGAKVGLLTALATALVLAIAVLPGMNAADGGDDGHAQFHAVGMNTAIAFGAGMAGISQQDAAPPGAKAMVLLTSDLEAQVKEANLPSDVRARMSTVVAALKSSLQGKSASKEISSLIDEVSKALEKTKDDPEKAKSLRDARERLIKISSELDTAAGTGPVQPVAGRMARPGGASPYVPSAAWIRGNKGGVIAQSEPSLALPESTTATLLSPGNPSYGWYSASVNGTASTIYFAPAGPDPTRATGRVFVAISDPPFRGGSGGGSKLGLLMLILGPLVVGLLGGMLAGGHGKPLKDLARELDRLGSSGDPTRRIAAHGPEANAIARSVERMVSNLKFRDQHQMADLQEVVSKEQEVAAQIHHGLMPKDPPRLQGYEVETLFKPGFEIGGDHFDYFRIDDTHLGVILMDTSVRGIQAAIVMSMARAYVRAEAPGVLSPAEVLIRVNRLLAADLSQGQYVTALYAVIDTSAGSAKVASAGHLPLVVYRHSIGKTAIVNPEGIALGLDIGPVFDRAISEVEIEVGVGDRLVLHTDGALKTQNETGDEFGEARLYDTIKQKAPMNSQAFVNFVGSAIDGFHLGTPQNDDITISTVKRLK